MADAGVERARFHAVVVGHELTTWSRDRFVALTEGPGRGAVLAPPRIEAGAVGRAGDMASPDALARAVWDRPARRAPFVFEGGDLAASARTLFIGAELLTRSRGRGDFDRAAIDRALRREVAGDIVWLHPQGRPMSQEDWGNGLRVLGMYLNGGMDIHHANFARFNDVAFCCPEYFSDKSSQSGIGFGLGGLIEFPLKADNKWFLDARLGLQFHTATLSQQQSTIFNDNLNGNIAITGAFDYTITAKTANASLLAMPGYRITNRMSIMAGHV